MKLFITRIMVLNLFTTFAIISQLKSGHCDTEQTRGVASSLTGSMEDLYDDGYFAYSADLSPNCLEDQEFEQLHGLIVLHEKFMESKNRAKKRLLAMQAAKIIKKLALSIKIRGCEEFRDCFVVFVKKTLESFEFDKNAITNFVLELQLESRMKLCWLKTKKACAESRKPGKALCFVFIAAVAVVGGLEKIGAFVYPEEPVRGIRLWLSLLTKAKGWVKTKYYGQEIPLSAPM